MLSSQRRSRFVLLNFIFALVLSLLSISAMAKPKIAVVVKSLKNEYFLEMQRGAIEFANKNKNKDSFDLIFMGTENELDQNSQIKIIEDLLNSDEKNKLSALIIAPVDSNAIIPELKKVLAKGVLLINLDNKIDVNELLVQGINSSIPFVGPSNYKAAKEVGDYLAMQLKEGNKVAILEGLPDSVNGKSRSEGFRKAMEDAKIKVVAVASGKWETNLAKVETSKILKEHPDISAILCANDSMALGAIEQLEENNMLGKVKVVGYDNIPKVQSYLKNKKLFATVEQYPSLQAQNAIELAFKLIKENKKQEQIDDKIVNTKTDVIK